MPTNPVTRIYRAYRERIEAREQARQAEVRRQQEAYAAEYLRVRETARENINALYPPNPNADDHSFLVRFNTNAAQQVPRMVFRNQDVQNACQNMEAQLVALQRDMIYRDWPRDVWHTPGLNLDDFVIKPKVKKIKRNLPDWW